MALIIASESAATGRPATGLFQTLLDGKIGQAPRPRCATGFGVGFGFGVGAGVVLNRRLLRIGRQ